MTTEVVLEHCLQNKLLMSKLLLFVQIEYGEFLPLPNRILDQYTRIECASFMGVLPEISR